MCWTLWLAVFALNLFSGIRNIGEHHDATYT